MTYSKLIANLVYFGMNPFLRLASYSFGVLSYDNFLGV